MNVEEVHDEQFRSPACGPHSRVPTLGIAKCRPGQDRGSELVFVSLDIGPIVGVLALCGTTLVRKIWVGPISAKFGAHQIILTPSSGPIKLNS